MDPVELRIEVAFSAAPRQIDVVALRLAPGSSVKDALVQSGLWAQAQGLSLGIWGRRTTLSHVLQDRDRVEVYRALTVDPKEARRVRYRAHGEKLPKGISRPKARVAPETASD
jgi:putative ubiquitin-RnfH superfamily antitoxin RatB of RatAB toxin-antitoxin module